MRHRVGGKRLGRDINHRQALLKSLSTALILNKKIETTLAKAKFVKSYVEKLITKANNPKNYSLVKYLTAKLNNNLATKKLLAEVAPVFGSRKGGYTRIVKLPQRSGDNAAMARIELVEN